MESIVINLDEPLFVPTVDMTLLDMVKAGGFSWPTGATCLTQESDGELIWWDAPVDRVVEAREVAQTDTGLMPWIGLGSVVNNDYYLLSGQEVVANNWKVAVVTLEQFTKE